MLGSAKHTAKHGGPAYRFAIEFNKEMFEEDPAACPVQYGGFCAYGAAVGKKSDGHPRVIAVVGGKLYFNLNPEIKAVWNKGVNGILTKADQQWTKIESKLATEL